jgi:poly-gamma-glutamate biosynthesis protein PgsC/CapC
MFVEAMGLSLVGALLSFEFVGLSPGGMIVPGYVALLAGRPYVLMALAAASGLVLVVVRWLAGYIILFSRRRFVLMVLIGFLCLRAIEVVVPTFSSVPVEVQGLGYLLPGLIANDMEKQGVVPTLLMTIVVSGAIRLVLLLFSPGALL